MADIGIIGGADGPTAVFVSSQIPLWIYCAFALAIVAVIAVVALLFKNRK